MVEGGVGIDIDIVVVGRGDSGSSSGSSSGGCWSGSWIGSWNWVDFMSFHQIFEKIIIIIGNNKIYLYMLIYTCQYQYILHYYLR